MSTGCKICDDIVVRTVVDEEIAKGNSYAFIARVMTARGFKVTPPTISSHRRHQSDYVEPAPAGAPPPGVLPKRDLAVLLKDRMLSVVETMSDDDLVAKDLQPFIGNAIKTQAVIDKRENVKRGNNTFILQLAGALADQMLQIEDGNTIEGEAVELE